jgi:signal transduction histidine kinase
MKRIWQIWLAFSIAVLLALFAFGALTRTLINASDVANFERAKTALADRTTAALFEMNQAIGPHLNRESSRRYEDYQPFPPSSDVGTLGELPANSANLKPSELLAFPPAYVQVYFQIELPDRWTSPQVPRLPDEIAKAQEYGISRQAIANSSLRLAELETAIDAKEFAELLARDNEFMTSSSLKRGGTAVMWPHWIGNRLIYARLLRVGKKEQIQGLVFDWPVLEDVLLKSIQTSLPQPVVRPDKEESRSDGRRLATLPIELDPGPVDFGDDPLSWTTRWALGTAWLLFLLATGAFAALLYAVLALSERRAAFVSAVTHELRTPLTTFRLYTEMLAEGMVHDPATQAKYLRTLQGEADRLKHLIENVLAYARLERGTLRDRMKTVPMNELLRIATQRLAQRATQSNCELVDDVSEECHDSIAIADPAAVEQILFNLVDNACKYAEAKDARLHLEGFLRGENVVLRVRDHGAGISEKEIKRLFQPFRKSAKDAANTAPGVGLGLALCRRLARQMHGDLTYEGDDRGAVFALTVPRAVIEAGTE